MIAATVAGPVQVLPAGAPRDQWLAERRKGIGASEIAAVLGISPWESPFSLYWRKVEGWATDDNDEMTAGRYAEPAVVQWFTDQHPEFELAWAGLYRHPDRPWQLATPDRLVYDQCLTCADDDIRGCTQCAWNGFGPLRALVECKYLIGGWDGWGEPGTDDIPVYYRAQCLWQADVLGVDEVYVAAWHGAEFRQYLVRRDEKDLRVMRAAGQRFMDRIAAGDPPPLDGHDATLATLKRLHPDLDDRVAEVSAATAAGYRRARALKARAEELLATFEARLRAEMADARVAACGGERVATRVISDVAESVRTYAAHRRDYLLAPRGKK